jgi:tRNA(adenine34) deaminase
VLFSSSHMPNDLHFMQLALAEAKSSAEAGEVPIGAVVIHAGDVMARSGNRTIRDNDPTAHAEIVVIREMAQIVHNYRLPGATLYVTIEPCAMCAGAIIQARISRVVYGADDPKGGAFHSCFQILTNAQLNHQVEVTPGVLAMDSASLLQQFFAARR